MTQLCAWVTDGALTMELGGSGNQGSKCEFPGQGSKCEFPAVGVECEPLQPRPVATGRGVHWAIGHLEMEAGGAVAGIGMAGVFRARAAGPRSRAPEFPHRPRP